MTTPPATTAFQAQLEAEGTQLRGEHLHFGALPETGASKGASKANNAGTYRVPLNQYGFIRAEGPDGQTFFQGQTTADFRQVTLNQARPGAYCTPKGRMLSNFTAARYADEGLLLKMRRDCIEQTLSVLGKYAIFSKVTLSEDTDTVGIGLVGAKAKSLIEQHFGLCPAAHLGSQAVADGLIIQRDDAGHRFELWLRDEAAVAAWEAFKPESEAAGSELWDELDIREGITDVCAATADEFLPQMLNFDLTGAVNFKKGCYTGQEVVARLHFKGVPKRRLYHATIDAEAAAGDAIYAGDKAVGTVANRISNGVAAVVLATQSAESDDLTLENGSRVTQVTVPHYGFE